MRQVSIFAENTKGAMQQVTQMIHDASINIMGMVTNDSAEYGIVRMIVSDPDKVVEILKAKGYICKTQRVIGVEIGDKPGALNKLLYDIDINVDYIYISYDRKTSAPIIILHTEDIPEVENCLTGKGYKVL